MPRVEELSASGKWKVKKPDNTGHVRQRTTSGYVPHTRPAGTTEIIVAKQGTKRKELESGWLMPSQDKKLHKLNPKDLFNDPMKVVGEAAVNWAATKLADWGTKKFTEWTAPKPVVAAAPYVVSTEDVVPFKRVKKSPQTTMKSAPSAPITSVKPKQNSARETTKPGSLVKHCPPKHSKPSAPRMATRARKAPTAPRGFASGFGTRSNVGEERKYSDVSLANLYCDTTGSVTMLNGLAAGTDATARVGRRVTLKSFHLRAFLQPRATYGAAGVARSRSLNRVMVVWDNNPNGGTIATITDILASATSTAHQNLNNRERFKVLMDVIGYQGGCVATTVTAPEFGTDFNVIERFQRLNNDVQFGGTGATIGDIQKGALLLVTIGNQVAGAGNGGEMNGTCRIRYTDA